MIDFEEAKRIAFETLSKIHVVSRLTDLEKKALGFVPEYSLTQYDVITVHTEFLSEYGIGRDVVLHIVLKPDFPLSIPKIYVEKDSYEHIRYIPHLDTNRLLCTFDGEISRTNPAFPGEIVKECLSRAIKIIEDGVAKKNSKDYETEFDAYWENSYSDQDNVVHDTLILIDSPPLKELNYISLEQNIGNYENIVYVDDDLGERFLNYLNYRKVKYKIQKICFLGHISIDFSPPFNLTNKSVEKIISKLSQDQRSSFKKYINGPEYPKIVLGFVKLETGLSFIGWIHHNKFITKRKGFRSNILNNYYVFKFLQKNDPVSRISTQIFTPNQSTRRTDGIPQTNFNYKFAIIGLGSVGSNLMYFLNTFNNPEFRLIDYDQLTIDNLNRHFLGIDYLGHNKTIALKHYYTIKNPFQMISFKNISVTEVVKNTPEYLNESDYLFCATGKANLEQWLGDSVKSIIKKPIFFFWVEPYLSAGHCLYVTPSSKEYRDFFDDDNFFRHNVISKSEYISGNSKLAKREAGCQTSYVPYSISSVVQFLSAIFPHVKSIISNELKNSMSITWINESKVLDDLGITKSEFLKAHADESIVIT